jgi:hypothetical protein
LVVEDEADHRGHHEVHDHGHELHLTGHRGTAATPAGLRKALQPDHREEADRDQENQGDADEHHDAAPPNRAGTHDASLMICSLLR